MGPCRMRIRRLNRVWVASLLALLFPIALIGYEPCLNSQAIRQAYFLGSGNKERAEAFLAGYIHRLPLPKRGPHVAWIEITTPYKQIVLRTLTNSAGFSPIDAERDYHHQIPLFSVTIRINVTPTYMPGILPMQPGSHPHEFWKDFEVRVLQHGRLIHPQTTSGQILYSAISGPRSSLLGASIEEHFAAAQIDSSPIQIQVYTPDGQAVSALFDLSKLK